eukprot:12400806-Karenia_brevis.AAC.1
MKELAAVSCVGVRTGRDEARKRVLELQLEEPLVPRLDVRHVAQQRPTSRPRTHAAGSQKRQASRPLARSEAEGHLMYKTDGLLWCFKCGAYAEHRVHKLASTCAGHATGSSAQRLTLLKEGLHPATGARLGESMQRVRLDDLISLGLDTKRARLTVD